MGASTSSRPGGWCARRRRACGLLLAGPVIYAMYESGGTLMAIWLGFSSLAGIALSVFVPLFAARKLQARLARA